MSVSVSQHVDYDQLVAALAQCIGYKEGDFLNVGQAICLPPYSPACAYVSTAGNVPGCKVYTVQVGDTLTSIASAFNVYTKDIISANEALLGAGGAVTPGMHLQLPPWDPATCKNAADADVPSCQVYSVKAGDSMSSIATAFGTSVDGLVAVNPGMNAASTLSVGQPIKIPPFPATCGAGTPVTGPPVGDVTVCRAYIVGPGESLNSIALKYGLTVADVSALNPDVTNPTSLTVGSTIKLPPWDDTCSQGVVINSP